MMPGDINLDILEGGKPVDKATQIPEKKLSFMWTIWEENKSAHAGVNKVFSEGIDVRYALKCLTDIPLVK